MSLGTADEVRARVDAIQAAGWSAVALAVGIERGVLGALADGDVLDAATLATRTGLSPELVGDLLDVLAADGFAEATPGGWRAAPGVRALAASDAAPRVQADLRAALAVQGNAARQAAEPGQPVVGWRGDDLLAVGAQAARSADTFEALAASLLPRLDGLVARLSAPGAALLEVGAGAAGLAVAAARRFPALRVVGVEPSAEARSAGWSAVFEAGLADRVALRGDEGAELPDLAEADAYDLAWMAQERLSARAWRAGLPAGVRALRPGGWLLAVTEARAGTDRDAAISRLRDRAHGGEARVAADLVEALQAAGLVDVAAHAAPRGVDVVAGRRAP